MTPIDIIVIARSPRRWREFCRAVWYMRGSPQPIRRWRGRPRAQRRPPWMWVGGAGLPFPRPTWTTTDLWPVFFPRPNWRALAVVSARGER